MDDQEQGFGRNPPVDWDTWDALEHRRTRLQAVLALARKHDEERRREAEIERELEDIDRAIAHGMESLPEERRKQLLRSLRESQHG